MKMIRFSMVCLTFLLLVGISGHCFTGPVCPPSGCPTQTAPPKAQVRQVNVNVPCPPQQCAPPVCPPPQCGPVCKPWVPPRPKPQMVPVRVEVAVRPESGCADRMAPLYRRNPGPFKPILGHTVGLVGSVIALPFGIAEMFHARTCKQKCPPRVCAPMCPPYQAMNPVRKCAPRPVTACAPQPSYPCPPPQRMYMPACPVPMTKSPCGPSVGPIPRPSCEPRYCYSGPPIPPRVVEEMSMYPAVEAQGLIPGVVQFPGRLLGRARWTGDLRDDRRGARCGPYPYR